MGIVAPKTRFNKDIDLGDEIYVVAGKTVEKGMVTKIVYSLASKNSGPTVFYRPSTGSSETTAHTRQIAHSMREVDDLLSPNTRMEKASV